MTDGLGVRLFSTFPQVFYTLEGETMEIIGLRLRADDHCVFFGSVLCAYGGVNEISNVRCRWYEVSVVFVYLYMCEYVCVFVLTFEQRVEEVKISKG